MKVFDINGNKYNIDESREIARGGEGRVLEFDKKSVAKIYLPGIKPITQSKFDSLSLIKSNAFVKPEMLLYVGKKIVGYTMRIVDNNDNYPLFSIYNSNFCQRHSIDDKYKHRLNEKLIEAIRYIHKNNIVVGDLNPFNIMLNDLCAVNFIDVDSYETTGNPHSRILLDDIRDYLYNGDVNKNSDYFALSVIIFNYLTNLHPFKGVHDRYKNMSERMIHKISVLSGDKHLIIPKCYKPIQDKYLEDQFKRIFNNGERFLISLSKQQAIAVTKPQIVKKKFSDLIVKDILINKNIKYVSASENYLVVKTDTQTFIYDVAYKGIYKLAYQLPLCDVFLTNDNIYIKENNSLFLLSKGDKKEIVNFTFVGKLNYHQYENILFVYDENMMYKLYLDNIIGQNLKLETRTIYGKGIRKYNGLMQNMAGNSYIFYNHKNILNSVKVEHRLKDIYQNKNIGMIQFVDNEQIRSSLFSIDGLNINFDTENYDNLRFIGYKENSFIVLPKDETLVFIRPDDFMEISKYECDLVDTNTEIFVTNSGIIIYNGDGIYLINKK
jgi:serine/threonine protein kinase